MKATIHFSLRSGLFFVFGVFLAVMSGGCKRTGQDDRGGRCPVMPLRLMLELKDRQPVEVLAIDAGGNLRVALTGDGKGVARLDPKGCLVGGDDVWVELTPGGDLWTLRQVYNIVDDRLLVGEKRMHVAADGRVVFIEPTGTPSDSTYGTFRFLGHKPEATCAERILMVAYLSMMPSMAVSDGNPVALPPPEGSVCR